MFLSKGSRILRASTSSIVIFLMITAPVKFTSSANSGGHKANITSVTRLYNLNHCLCMFVLVYHVDCVVCTLWCR